MPAIEPFAWEEVAWQESTYKATRRLVCLDCDHHVRFQILRKPVERKRRTVTAHKVRLVAKCTKCGKRQTLQYGAPMGRII